MHFLFTLADVGIDLSLAPQVECDHAVDLFQGEGGEILLDRLRALAASEGVDNRIQRHTRARDVIPAISLFAYSLIILVLIIRLKERSIRRPVDLQRPIGTKRPRIEAASPLRGGLVGERRQRLLWNAKIP